MAVLGSTLRLFLWLGLLFCFASATNYSEHCMTFKNVTISSKPGIQLFATVYENSTFYTVLVPVNKNISSVVLRAVDKNNNSVGFWDAADDYCNTSVLYRVKNADSGIFKTKWKFYSKSTTKVILQAFAVDFNKEALFSSLELNTGEDTTTTKHPNTSTASHTSLTKANTTPATSPTTHPYKTLSTTRHTSSSASGAFLNPIIDTVRILFVFLISKLLF